MDAVEVVEVSGPMDINVTLPLPPLVNRYWRRGRYATYLSPEGRAYKQAVAGILDAQPTDRPVSVSATIYRKRRAGDVDGYAKGLLDSMQGLVYVDDAQVTDLYLHRRDDKTNPRVEVRVWKTESSEPDSG
jgi:crossover junction endodeoxyribonuclease RusA